MDGNSENIDDVVHSQRGIFLVLEGGGGNAESHVLPTEVTRTLGEDSLRIYNARTDSHSEAVQVQLNPNATCATDDRSQTLADFIESFDF